MKPTMFSFNNNLITEYDDMFASINLFVPFETVDFLIAAAY